VEVEQVSVDEAYLDASTLHRDADPEEALVAAVRWARELKARIRSERQLTASIGIASNKLMAKVASDWGKPDGLLLIPDRDRAAFLRPLPARTLHGIGRVTEEVLLKAGIRTVGDLQDHPGDLKALVGTWGPVLKSFAFGVDERPLSQDDTLKSISTENTFSVDTADRPTLRAVLREQAEPEDRAGFVAVAVHPGRQEDPLGAQSTGGTAGHRRAHPESPGLITGRTDHAPGGGRSADDDRESPQIGTIPLFDRRKERVHVQMQDDAGCPHAPVMIGRGPQRFFEVNPLGRFDSGSEASDSGSGATSSAGATASSATPRRCRAFFAAPVSG
jgi:hypothetical protein